MIRDLPDLTPRRDVSDLMGEIVSAVAGMTAAALLVTALVVV